MKILFQVVQTVPGGDLLLLGFPVAVVIMLLVQLLKMLSMPSKYAPWASLAVGLVVAWAVQASKGSPYTVSVVIYTLILAASYSLMANGMWSVITTTQSHINGTTVELTEPTHLPTVLRAPITEATPLPPRDPMPMREGNEPVHVIGSGPPLGN